MVKGKYFFVSVLNPLLPTKDDVSSIFFLSDFLLFELLLSKVVSELFFL